MALKDLIAQKSAVTEETIEKIVVNFVRYDPEAKEVTPTPAFSGLSNRTKILVYLTALQGWPFVIDEPVTAAAKPAQIESQLGIPGGTLRPLLKELKEGHYITVKDGAYGIHPANLPLITVEVTKGSSASVVLKPRVKRQPAKREPESESSKTEISGNPKPRSVNRKSGIAQKFDNWVSTGFFDAPKSLADVQRRFAKEGIILPQTSVPKYLLAAIRKNQLEREEAEVSGRKVWLYHTKKQ